MSTKRSALIVATSEYHDSRLTALAGPGQDAEALQTVLSNAEIGGFDVQLALNSPVDSLRRTLESFFANRSRDDLLLVHFSGHGLKDDDGQLFLAAADTEIDRLLSTGVDAAWVNRLMSKCRSERIALFLDCCFAGAFTTGMARRAGVDTAGVKEQFNGSGLFVIAASDAMQYSFEGGRQIGEPPEPSPFTKALVDGLQSGEADRDEDGHVSINELFDYLEDRIRETSPSQTPTKSAFNQVGDWVIARSTRVPSIRLLPDGVQQHMKSENPVDRIGVLIELRDLLRGTDSRLADAAKSAVQRLAQDDSRSVAARAQRVLDEEATRSGSASVASASAAPVESAPAAAVVAPSPPAVVVPPPPAVVAAPPPTAVAPRAHAAVAPSPPAVTAPSAPAWGASPPPASAPAAPPVTWGQTQNVPPAASHQAVAAPGAHRGQAGSVPWNLGRAVTRAFIGSFLWVTFQYMWVLGMTEGLLESPDELDFVTNVFSQLAVIITISTTLFVAIGEQFVTAFRLPGGSVYSAVGNNRWGAAAILGGGVGLTVGLLVEFAYFGTIVVYGLNTLVCAALGFIVAEVIVGRRFAGKGEERSQTA